MARPPGHQPFGPGLPDFEFINQLPILDVARKLGLTIREDKQIVCWRIGQHATGSVGLLAILPSNRVKCVECDSESLSVLDLAKAVGEFESLRDAAECVAIDFDVPRTLQGSHLKNPDGLPVPPACDDPLALLVRSGVWATLSIHAQRLIPVFLGLGIWDDGDWDCIVTVANRALMRYGHIASFTNISVGVAELERVGWLMRMEPRGRGAMPIKGAMPYHLTPLSERVRELADATAPAFGDAIRKEKSERKRKRQEREQHLLLQQKRFRQRGRRP